MSETSETTTGAGAISEVGAGGRAAAEAGAGAGGRAAETVATASGRVGDRAAAWFRMTTSPPAASNRALVIASLGIQPPEGDCFFAADNSMGGTRTDFFSGFGATTFF